MPSWPPPRRRLVSRPGGFNGQAFVSAPQPSKVASRARPGPPQRRGAPHSLHRQEQPQAFDSYEDVLKQFKISLDLPNPLAPQPAYALDFDESAAPGGFAPPDLSSIKAPDLSSIKVAPPRLCPSRLHRQLHHLRHLVVRRRSRRLRRLGPPHRLPPHRLQPRTRLEMLEHLTAAGQSQGPAPLPLPGRRDGAMAKRR